MEQTLRAHLIALKDAYCAATDASVSTVAQAACGDWRFFERVGEPPAASFRIRTYDKALEWFAARWPAGLAWPSGVERPDLSGLAGEIADTDPSATRELSSETPCPDFVGLTSRSAGEAA